MSFDVTQNPSPDSAEGPMQALSAPSAPVTPAPAYGDAGQPQAPPQAPAAAPQPGVWKRVVAGALSGLVQGGVPGALIGGVASTSPEQFNKIQTAQKQRQDISAAHVQQAQNLPKFQDAQTAAMVTDSAMKQRAIDQMPEELRLKQEAGARATAEYLTGIYGPPTQITQYDPNDPTDAAAHASLNQAAATNGGVVPPTATVHVGDTLLHWNANDMASSPSSLAHINDAAKLLGRPEMAPADYQRLKPADRIAQMSALMALIEPDTAMDPGKVNGALVGAKQALAAAPKDANPQLKGLLTQRVDFLQATHDSNLKDQKDIAGLKAASAQAATEPTKQADTGKTELNKIWAGDKGYASALQQGKQTIDSIKAGADGNGLLTSMASTMEVLGVNRAAGVTRISPAEAAAANLPGSYSERFNAWADKASSGKLSPQLASEGKQLMNIVLDSAHAKAVQESLFTAKQRGIPASNAVALSRNGKLTTLDKLSDSPRYGTLNNRRVVSYDNGKTTQPAE